MKSIIKIFGGKSLYVNIINETLSRYPHKIFLDAFVGGANVILNKEKVARETICDLNESLINFYKVVRDRPYPLITELGNHTYTQESFDWAVDYDTPQDELIWATKYFVRNRMSFGGLMGHYSWSNRIRRGMPENVSSYLGAIDRIFAVSERLQGVTIIHGNTLDLFDELPYMLDNPNMLTYLDPSYLPDTRESPDVYKHEMSVDDHIRLLKQIRSAKCGVVISGYASDLYESHLDKFVRREYHTRVNMSKRKDGKCNDRVEVLWSNF